MHLLWTPPMFDIVYQYWTIFRHYTFCTSIFTPFYLFISNRFLTTFSRFIQLLPIDTHTKTAHSLSFSFFARICAHSHFRLSSPRFSLFSPFLFSPVLCLDWPFSLVLSFPPLPFLPLFFLTLFFWIFCLWKFRPSGKTLPSSSSSTFFESFENANP